MIIACGVISLPILIQCLLLVHTLVCFMYEFVWTCVCRSPLFLISFMFCKKCTYVSADPYKVQGKTLDALEQELQQYELPMVQILQEQYVLLDAEHLSSLSTLGFEIGSLAEP